ncbi:uncharacterized protein LOC117513426 [Thalassophryne amazonica]|uniref:uncharacterized protein LOC117513426 n=1 Tax=Thalassophryne amazonica TaxID=390379 RepID=UPI0014712559|nr:uncharacterized protein LOC117513426 [Thalassophryne amazonica]
MAAFCEIWDIFICICIMWNSSTLAFGDSTHQLKIHLGCQAVIPCTDYKSSSNSLKWFFTKHGHDSTIQLISEDEQGILHFDKTFKPRISVMHNQSLVIRAFTGDDQGQYWCEFWYQGKRNQKKTIHVETEVLHETRMTRYVLPGSTFSHTCPGEFKNFEWTFEASSTPATASPNLKKTVHGPEAHFVTLNKSIHLLNIKRTDAGKYSCWTNRCRERKQKLLTINLCVITVLDHSDNSSVPCTVICDMDTSDINPNTIDMEMETWNISVVVDSLDSLQCNAMRKFYKSSAVNNSLGPTNTFNETTERAEPLIFWTIALCGCLALLALVLFCFRSTQRTE